MATDAFELFKEQDFDQEKLEKEAAMRPAVVLEKKQEKENQEETEDTVTESHAEKKLYIIDGYGLIYRSYYGFFNNPIKDTQGNNVSA
ncbi:MAG: hypothetical protein PHO09_12590, partial [Sphaerochaeta sp.]|nr:hypothetical protein [Sphaerochaeta sp.]